MSGALLVNAAVDAVVGLALLALWRGEPALRFARTLSGLFLVQALRPLALLAWQNGPAPANNVAAATFVGAASASLALWLEGVAELAGRPLRRRRAVHAMLGAIALAGVALAHQPALAQSVGAGLTVLGGVIGIVRLRRNGWEERMAAFAMLALGLTEFAPVGADAADHAGRVGLATVWCAALGWALLRTAAGRDGGGTARHWRDQFLRLVERSHQGIAVLQGGTVKYANPALLRLYGLPVDAGVVPLDTREWPAAAMFEPDPARARERHRRIVSGELAQQHWEGERRAVDGRALHLRFSASRVEWNGAPAEQIVVIDDTAHVDATLSLLHEATHDELTGLPNRSALQQRLRGLCAAVPVQAFALLLLDVDRFKLFNEAHGATVGDQVLRALAATLVERFGAQAQVMRFGEDEFALLAPAETAAQAEQRAHELAQGVRARMQQPFDLPRHRFFLDVSIGIALYPASAVRPDALLRSADAALHEAKRTPGSAVQFAEARFEQGSGATLEAEQALRAGMEADEFRLVYQPKVDAGSGALVGFEALVRWDRPTMGLVQPTAFIPAAERTGLIAPLGQLILTLACRQIAAWQAAFGRAVPVAVNVSPLQLLDPGFPDAVVRTLRQHDVPAGLLTLEITESAAVTHMDRARGQIGQLRAHGVGVALDDFGTGFSSLNMLRGLPLSTVKIDRTLVDPMPAPDASAIVKAICDLAGVLGLEVVAEGVETIAHARAALEAGCGVLQGFLYARPLDAAEAAQWMRERVPMPG